MEHHTQGTIIPIRDKKMLGAVKCNSAGSFPTFPASPHSSIHALHTASTMSPQSATTPPGSSPGLHCRPTSPDPQLGTSDGSNHMAGAKLSDGADPIRQVLPFQKSSLLSGGHLASDDPPTPRWTVEDATLIGESILAPSDGYVDGLTADLRRSFIEELVVAPIEGSTEEEVADRFEDQSNQSQKNIISSPIMIPFARLPGLEGPPSFERLTSLNIANGKTLALELLHQ